MVACTVPWSKWMMASEKRPSLSSVESDQKRPCDIKQKHGIARGAGPSDPRSRGGSRVRDVGAHGTQVGANEDERQRHSEHKRAIHVASHLRFRARLRPVNANCLGSRTLRCRASSAVGRAIEYWRGRTRSRARILARWALVAIATAAPRPRPNWSGTLACTLTRADTAAGGSVAPTSPAARGCVHIGRDRDVDREPSDPQSPHRAYLRDLIEHVEPRRVRLISKGKSDFVRVADIHRRRLRRAARRERRGQGVDRQADRRADRSSDSGAGQAWAGDSRSGRGSGRGRGGGIGGGRGGG